MRNCTRKTNRAYWNEADMKQAVEAVKSKTATIRKAAIEFHIPFETLRRRCKIVIPAQHPDLCKKKLGRFSPVQLSADQENELVQYIHQMEISCYDLTIADLRRLVYEFFEKNKIIHPFNKDNKMAGRDFVAGFLTRHSNVLLRKPEAISLNRVYGLNKVSVDNILKTWQKFWTLKI